MPRSSRARRLIERLARQEADFLHREVLAPAVPGGEIRVRLDGAICRLRVSPPDFAGFGVFCPASFVSATLTRPATLAERQAYLRLFPLVRMILAERAADRWLALPSQASDVRGQLPVPAFVELVEDGQRFETVRCRFDGAALWFEGADARSDPATAAYLRESLQRQTPSEALRRRGLTPPQRRAYQIALQGSWPAASTTEAANRSPGTFWSAPWIANVRDAPPESASALGEVRPGERDAIGRRLRQALAHSGAELVDYHERGDAYRVTYEVDGRRVTSAVAKEDLTVYSAGICLSGGDRQFDLNSLVGVLREGQDKRTIVPLRVE